MRRASLGGVVDVMYSCRKGWQRASHREENFASPKTGGPLEGGLLSLAANAWSGPEKDSAVGAKPAHFSVALAKYVLFVWHRCGTGVVVLGSEKQVPLPPSQARLLFGISGSCEGTKLECIKLGKSLLSLYRVPSRIRAALTLGPASESTSLTRAPWAVL